MTELMPSGFRKVSPLPDLVFIFVFGAGLAEEDGASLGPVSILLALVVPEVNLQFEGPLQLQGGQCGIPVPDGLSGSVEREFDNLGFSAVEHAGGELLFEVATPGLVYYAVAVVVVPVNLEKDELELFVEAVEVGVDVLSLVGELEIVKDLPGAVRPVYSSRTRGILALVRG